MGTASLFMMFAPLEGRRHVKVTQPRTAMDYAHGLKQLADVLFAGSEKSVPMQDNSPPAGGVRRAPLDTHKPASLTEAFPAAEARWLVERFEWPDTPKHGSWLEMADSELGVVASQCLDRRIPDMPTLAAEVAAWEADRNQLNATADRQFTPDDARIKLKHLYPLF